MELRKLLRGIRRQLTAIVMCSIVVFTIYGIYKLRYPVMECSANGVEELVEEVVSV